MLYIAPTTRYMEKKKFELKIVFTGAVVDDLDQIREFYCEPLTKVLRVDVLEIIKKHKERIETPPDKILKKK